MLESIRLLPRYNLPSALPVRLDGLIVGRCDASASVEE